MSRNVVALLACGMTALAAAAAEGPSPVLPDGLEWVALPGNPQVEAAWVVGTGRAPGLYALRVRIREGGAVPPHAHPDTRYSTVLSGTLYVGFGEQRDEAGMVAVPAGAAYVAPAGVPHYLSARDGEVVYQEGGFGPTATQPPGAPPTAGVALREQVMAAETAFAATMAARDFAAFAAFVDDEAIFFSGTGPLRGKPAVLETWARYFEGDAAPFSWQPDEVEVLPSGTLAHSSGPVFRPDGTMVARFNSVWRQSSPGVWKVILDKGSPLPAPAPGAGGS